MSVPGDIDPRLAGRYFGEKLGTPVEIVELKQTYPGFSRQTWLIRARLDGRTEGFVLRLDPPWGASVPQSLRHEWEVYWRLYGSEIPVAEPLWYDEGQWFADGLPLMVRRMVEGSSTIPGLRDAGEAGEALRRRIVEEHLEKLAALHRLDWRARGFGDFIPTPPSPAEALAFEYRAWREMWEARRSEPFPIITEFLCWLGESIPRDTPAISLVKGNNGVGEEVFRDGRIVAMSDWELAALGDPALDLAFSQGTLALSSLDQVRRSYEALTGDRISDERLAFAMLWIRFKAIVCINGFAFAGVADGRDIRPTFASLGYISVKGRQKDLASCIGKDLVTAFFDSSSSAGGRRSAVY